MAHMLHMNLQIYGPANVTVDGAGAIAARSVKQTQLTATLNAYRAGPAAGRSYPAGGAAPVAVAWPPSYGGPPLPLPPVDVAGFTELRAGLNNIPRMARGLVDLCTQGATPLMPGGVGHVFIATVGMGINGSLERLGICTSAGTALTGWGRRYLHSMTSTVMDLPAPLGGHLVRGTAIPLSRRAAAPPQSVGQRCLVYVDVTVGGVGYRVGFVHNIFVTTEHRYAFMSRAHLFMGTLGPSGALDVMGGDLNTLPATYVGTLQNHGLELRRPGVNTTLVNEYDWWLLQTGGIGPCHVTASGVPGVGTGSDHRAIGLHD